MSETKIRAPFQFVPFSNKVLIPYQSADELPRHDAILPNLKSGEIHLSLRAETPIFVSDGKQYPDNVQRFFRGANGKRMIPGSTLRGLLRENMQILGFGLVRPGEDIEDERIYYRSVADAAKSVSKRAKDYYWNALGYKPDEKHPTPDNVKSGWIRKENNGYVIYPTRGSFIRVSRDHPDVVKYFQKGDPLQFPEENARTEEVAYTPNAERIVPRRNAEPGMKYGMLLYTGRPVADNKGKRTKALNHLYLFPEIDAASTEATEVRKEDELSYLTDWERRKNTLGKHAGFWKLPEKNGEIKPVFYARVNGHLYFGMSLFPRIGYPHSLTEGLPGVSRNEDGELLYPHVIDYPRAILGFVEQDGEAYRSRVSVGDLETVGNPAECAQVSMVLGNPKPSWYPGYTIVGKDYTQDDFRLRGYKQYWIKDVQKTATDAKQERVASKFRPLPAGTEFRGVIRYRNLTEEELGLLLWCLRLEEGCYQTVGMGKPYGYGCVKLTIDRLRELNPETLYGSDLGRSPWKESEARIPAYIADYQTAAAKRWNRDAKDKDKISSIAEREDIQSFFFMKQKHALLTPEEVSYMTLPEFQASNQAGKRLPSLREAKKDLVRRSAEANAQKAQAPQSMQEWKQALQETKRPL